MELATHMQHGREAATKAGAFSIMGGSLLAGAGIVMATSSAIASPFLQDIAIGMGITGVPLAGIAVVYGVRFAKNSKALLWEQTALMATITKGRKTAEKVKNHLHDIRRSFAQHIEMKKEHEKDIASLRTKAQTLKEQVAKKEAMKGELTSIEKELQKKKLEIRTLEKKEKIEKKPIVPQPTNGSTSAHLTLGTIRKQFPAFPPDEQTRIAVERQIARALVHEQGFFNAGSIIKAIDTLYPSIQPEEKVMVLQDVRSWMERDSLIRQVTEQNGMTQYVFV